MSGWGSLNFVKPEWRDDDADNVGDYVVDNYRHGPSDLRVAFELLALSGKVDMAQRLEGLMSTTYQRDVAILEHNELDEMIGILGEVPVIARKTLVDENDRVPTDKVEQLKSRSSELNFGNAGGHIPEDGVVEGILRVHSVRKALEAARARGLDVALN
ncbi:MAG: hypothetical protein ABJE66_13510 [Deltaproteobacteria bacterium]